MCDAGVASAGALSWLEATLDRPIKDQHEALALIIHGLVLSHGFRPPTQSPEQVVDLSKNTVLPKDWGIAGYGGKYKHHRSALNYEIRAVPLGGKLMVHATPVEDEEKVFSLNLSVPRYVKQNVDFSKVKTVKHSSTSIESTATAIAATTTGACSSAPEQPPLSKDDTFSPSSPISTHTQDTAPPSTESKENNTTETRTDEDLVELNTVYENLTELALRIQSDIVYKLIPDSAKDGYEPGPVRSPQAALEAASRAQTNQRQQERYIYDQEDPLRIGNPRYPPHRPVNPLYMDEDPYNEGGLMPPMRRPPMIGDDDLLPVGLPQGMGGRFPPPPFGPGMGGGSLMGPRHPGWGNPPSGPARPGISDPNIGGIGPRLPRGAVPPGARFDPFGPPLPPDHPSRAGRPSHPDHDIDMPPPDTMFM